MLFFTALFLFLLTVLIGVSLSFLICFYSFYIYSVNFFSIDLLLYMFFDVYKSCDFFGSTDFFYKMFFIFIKLHLFYIKSVFFNLLNISYEPILHFIYKKVVNYLTFKHIFLYLRTSTGMHEPIKRICIQS